MNEFKLNVEYFTQLDNKLFSSTSCYPTSMAMTMNFCLQRINRTKESVGCPSTWQLEDFITNMSESNNVKQWLASEGVKKYGKWVLDYKPRVVAYTESHIFNLLMKDKFKYTATFKDNLTYKEICDQIEFNEMPVPIHGTFPFLQGGGHICCAVGFVRDKEILIVHDPFGNADFDKYKSHTKGEYAYYFVSKYFYKKDKFCWGQIIERS